jgi:hypothetical protein
VQTTYQLTFPRPQKKHGLLRYALAKSYILSHVLHLHPLPRSKSRYFENLSRRLRGNLGQFVIYGRESRNLRAILGVDCRILLSTAGHLVMIDRLDGAAHSHFYRCLRRFIFSTSLSLTTHSLPAHTTPKLGLLRRPHAAAPPRHTRKPPSANLT